MSRVTSRVTPHTRGVTHTRVVGCGVARRHWRLVATVHGGRHWPLHPLPSFCLPLRPRPLSSCVSANLPACLPACRVSDESDTGVDRSSFTMRDLVEWGIAHPSQATETLLALLEEARKVTEYPVMVAIDGVNLLYEKTEYPLKGDVRRMPTR